MPFAKIIAIDWSGAQAPRYNRKIQVAEYDPGNHTVRLAARPGNPPREWSRDDVLEYVQREVERSQVLIGFDFAFAYPFCDEGAYFPIPPGEQQNFQPPQGFQQLWATVEERCADVPNLYGTPFIADGSPFRRYHRIPGFLGDRFQPRHRITELAAQPLGLNPTSIFHCIGPAAVGIGSMAGMRLLHQLHGTVCIWPFDVNGPPEGSTVVEIYPRVFLRQSQNNNIEPTAGNINALCAYFGADLQHAPQDLTDDQRDALVSAAGMGWRVRQEPNWQVPDCAATYKGWIFGV